MRRGEHFFSAHSFDRCGHGLEREIPIVDEKSGRLIPRERLAELLGGPRGVRTCRHRGVNHAPAVVREND